MSQRALNARWWATPSRRGPNARSEWHEGPPMRDLEPFSTKNRASEAIGDGNAAHRGPFVPRDASTADRNACFCILSPAPAPESG